MSLVAQVWVSNLPLDTGMNLAAFRVLDKLADAHHSETNSAYRTADRLAGELRCSKRTVQRAIKDLQLLGFIARGDQRLVSHIDPRHRPIVWELALDRWTPTIAQPELAGVTAGVTPERAVDNSPGVTTVVAPGVTPVVTQNGIENKDLSTKATTVRVSPHTHTWRWTSVGQFCSDCGVRDDGRKRISWDSMRITLVRQSA